MMTNHACIADRLDLLREAVSIGNQLSILEGRYGAQADIQAARDRQQRVCLEALMQLFAWLSADMVKAH